MVTWQRPCSDVLRVLRASWRMYIWLGLPHVHERPVHLLGTYIRLQCERATGCNGVLSTGNLPGDSCSEGAGRSPNRVRKGAMSALRQLEGFLDATEPSWELPLKLLCQQDLMLG